MREQLLSDYAEKIRPLLPLAKRAYGARTYDTPAHAASREYTRLLTEFYASGGSLLSLAKELDVAYAGLRRRVITADSPVAPNRGRGRATPEQVAEALVRVQAARSTSVAAYHRQLLTEYESGVSLGKLAVAMGLSGANPLYYGVHRARSLGSSE